MTKKKDERPRYSSNPFVHDMVISKRSKRVEVSTLGSDDNVLLNQKTGEIKGTHVMTYKQVDDEKFVKLFTQNIALTFDLTPSGIKALSLVMWLMQKEGITRDLLRISTYVLDDFNKVHSKTMSKNVMYRGLNDLIDNQILAAGREMASYYVNPNFIFNGDRIAFSTMIERKRRSDARLGFKGDAHKQTDIEDHTV